MKNLFLFLIAVLSTGNVWAREVFKLNPSPQRGNSSYSYAPQADEITMSWLTSTTEATSFGLNGQGTMSVFMEFYPEDMLNFNATGKKPVSIKQVQFYLNAEYSKITTDVSVCIRQGTSFYSSTEIVSQIVTNPAKEWNYVDLTKSYTIDHSQNLYIGYRFSQTEGGYPCSVAEDDNPKQAWYLIGESSSNLAVDYGYVFLIQAIADTESSPENEIVLQSLDMPLYAIQGNNLAVAGTLQNLGTVPLTSFAMTYDVDGKTSASHTFANLNIAPNAIHVFEHPDSLIISEAKAYNVSATISKPNNMEDVTTNNSRNILLQVYSELIPRMVLHESFTSATCGPCKAGNESLKDVLEAVDTTKWVNIRYQMDWPSPGDPYYTIEGGSRCIYYDINSVPQMVVDGGKDFNAHPANYTEAKLNELAGIPAMGRLLGKAVTTGKTVKAEITVTPVTNTTDPDLHLFAAVVEKKTIKNKKTNGENEFLFVMKKFLTAEEGDAVGGFKVGEDKTFKLSYTFNGDYRLPNNAGTPIRHDTEHSVENFENLMVAYWIQNVQTKEVCQAGRADATFDTSQGLDRVARSGISARIHGESLFINSETPVRQAVLYNLSGQKVLPATGNDKVVDVNRLSSGIYILKLQTAEGEKIIKVIK